MVWEFIFLMVILKIPVIYLCAVVYWAIKAEPRPPEGAPVSVRVGDRGPEAGQQRLARRDRRPRRGPHGSPTRRPTPSGLPAQARARGDE